MGRRPCCEKVGLRKGRWTAEEDQKLMEFIHTNGVGSWRSLPKNAGLLRCGKSCRLRWINYLRSDLKRGHFTSDEEDLIIKLRASFGTRWSLIASLLPGRTDNEIKNYWNIHLCRKIHTVRRRTENGAAPAIIQVAKLNLPPRRKGSRRSKPESSGEIKQSGEMDVGKEESGNPEEAVRRVGDVDSGILCDNGISDDVLWDLDGLLSATESDKSEEAVRHDGTDEGILRENGILDDEWWDLDRLLSGTEWDDRSNGGAWESKNTGTTAEVEICNSGNTNYLMGLSSDDSSWEWESVVQSIETWNDDDREMNEGRGVADFDSIFT